MMLENRGEQVIKKWEVRKRSRKVRDGEGET